MALESSWVVFGRHVGLLGHLVGILERLVDVLGQLGEKVLCHPCATPVQHLCLVEGAQGPPIRILYDFPDHYKDHYKEKRIRIVLGCGILHAMRRHKAWRGGTNCAVELRPRHRANSTVTE